MTYLTWQLIENTGGLTPGLLIFGIVYIVLMIVIGIFIERKNKK